MQFNELIKKCRKNAKMTQKKLAEKMNMSQNAISQYETGKRSIDSETMELFMNFFGIEINVDVSLIKKKYTNVMKQWNKEWKEVLKQKNEKLKLLKQEERKFLENIYFIDAHWFDLEDLEEDFHIGVKYKEKDYCIQRIERNLVVFDYPAFSKEVFSEKSLLVLYDILDDFEIEERLNELHR